jgi:hypothetical protein
MNVPAGVPLGVQLIVVEVFPLASLMLPPPKELPWLIFQPVKMVWPAPTTVLPGVVPPMNKLSNTSSSPTSPFTVTLGAALTVSKPLEGPMGVVKSTLAKLAAPATMPEPTEFPNVTAIVPDVPLGGSVGL